MIDLKSSLAIAKSGALGRGDCPCFRCGQLREQEKSGEEQSVAGRASAAPARNEGHAGLRRGEKENHGLCTGNLGVRR